MNDAESGKLVNATFDGAGILETIRERLRHAVASVLEGGAGEVELVCRMAADELAALLIEERGVITLPASRPAGIHAVRPRITTGEDVERRATAFRAMAGVRV